jgi:protein-L-isoaspartate(D-aspartate) O-methyltransferase
VLDVRKIRLILELRELGISSSNVLSAIERVPREIFIPKNFRNQAYENIALPIGDNQTISQPYIVALMTQSLEVEKKHKVLELGTGSGYQCSVISLLARRVYTIERIKSLSKQAESKFDELKLTNIVTKFADGNLGWKEQIPFDRIIFTAATNQISKIFIDHLIDGGIIIAPIIEGSKQILKKFTKIKDKILVEKIADVLFVPNLSGTKS